MKEKGETEREKERERVEKYVTQFMFTYILRDNFFRFCLPA